MVLIKGLLDPFLSVEQHTIQFALNVIGKKWVF